MIKMPKPAKKLNSEIGKLFIVVNKNAVPPDYIMYENHLYVLATRAQRAAYLKGKKDQR